MAMNIDNFGLASNYNVYGIRDERAVVLGDYDAVAAEAQEAAFLQAVELQAVESQPSLSSMPVAEIGFIALVGER